VWNVGIVFLRTYVFSDCRSHSLWYLVFFQIGSVSSHYVCPCWTPDLSLWCRLVLKGPKFMTGNENIFCFSLFP